MLTLEIPAKSIWDEGMEIFIDVPAAILKLEHSLVSLSKWEAKWKKPFFDDKAKTYAEMIDYIRCMSLDEITDSGVFNYLGPGEIAKIKAYMNDTMTATWFTEHGSGGKGSLKKNVVTAEIIYYWMISLQIPMECQYWHLNRLLTLIRVCNAKNAPSKKMSKKEVAMQNHRLNAQRRKASRSRG